LKTAETEINLIFELLEIKNKKESLQQNLERLETIFEKKKY
jgi:uncharacterized protein YjaG (DUF416 family)